MNNHVKPHTLNFGIFAIAIIMLWAITLDQCIVFNSEYINFRTCSEKNKEGSLIETREKLDDECNILDETEIKTKESKYIFPYLFKKFKRKNSTTLT